MRHISQHRLGDIITHHSRSWIRHPAFVSPPLVVRTLLMGKWSIESFSDVSHTVNTDSEPLEHIAMDEKCIRENWTKKKKKTY